MPKRYEYRINIGDSESCEEYIEEMVALGWEVESVLLQGKDTVALVRRPWSLGSLSVWYVLEGKERIGPFLSRALAKAGRAGKVKLWREWISEEDYLGLRENRFSRIRKFMLGSPDDAVEFPKESFPIKETPVAGIDWGSFGGSMSSTFNSVSLNAEQLDQYRNELSRLNQGWRSDPQWQALSGGNSGNTLTGQTSFADALRGVNADNIAVDGNAANDSDEINYESLMTQAEESLPPYRNILDAAETPESWEDMLEAELFNPGERRRRQARSRRHDQ